jgi:hypothetical protein
MEESHSKINIVSKELLVFLKIYLIITFYICKKIILSFVRILIIS